MARRDSRDPSKRPGSGPSRPTPTNLYVDMTVDLHGLRPNDAIAIVDVHLLRCQAAGLLFAHVVHGRGTGALRLAVREHLAKHPLVARFRDGSYGMGGDGVTVVELKRRV